jgi:hypothetical protein
LGVSERSIYDYLKDKKLTGFRDGEMIMLLTEEVHAFERKAPGRMRIPIPLWHTPPKRNRQSMTTITFRVRPESSDLLESKIEEFWK